MIYEKQRPVHKKNKSGTLALISISVANDQHPADAH